MFDLPGVPGCSEQDSGDLAVVLRFLPQYLCTCYLELLSVGYLKQT